MKDHTDLSGPCVNCAGNPLTLKRQLALRRRNLLNPRYADPRRFPLWRKGMTTEQYLKLYASMNASRKLIAIEHTHAPGVAPWNEETEA